MTRSLFISSLRQCGIRNLQTTEIAFAPSLNVLSGDNGQGKTSLLEALVLATTSRSFRTDQTRDLIQYGAGSASAEVEVDDSGFKRHQSVQLVEGRKFVQIDGKRAAKTADFAVLTPVVVFHPADLELASGPAALRRTLLARVSLYLEPWSFGSHKSYQQALRARQRLLMEQGPTAPDLDAFEQVAAEHGVAVTAAYLRAANHLIEAIGPILRELAPTELTLDVLHLNHGTTDPSEFRRQLREFRRRDQIRGRALFGPQRNDLELKLDGADTRRHASQGQQRLLALALKLAELASIRNVRNVHPILLLDDVSSELDPHRTSALLDWLRGSQSQVFITTTRWHSTETAFQPLISPRHFLVRGGVAEQEKSTREPNQPLAD